MRLSALRRELISSTLMTLGILSSKHVFTAPRLVFLDLCEACNTRCIMCQRHSPLAGVPSHELEAESAGAGGQRWRSMDRELAEMISSECAAAGTHKVFLGESGEPTIHPHFDSILDFVIQQGLSPTVLTNGMGADERRARLWASKRAHFCVSVHAGDADTWLQVHPGHTIADYERLCRTIRILAEGGPQRVSLKVVMQRANSGRVREIIEFAHRQGVRDLRFRPVVAGNNLRGVTLTLEEERTLLQELRSCRTLAEGYGITTNVGEYLSTSWRVRSGVVHTEDLYRRVPCYVGWHLAFVRADGTVVPCDNSDRVMGHTGEDRFLDIWRSPGYQAFRIESIGLPSRSAPVAGCDCTGCNLFRTNVKTHRLLHPFAQLTPERTRNA
jgi:MoaA/NifB/PqqE/SkfB family radical SAM enzyme